MNGATDKPTVAVAMTITLLGVIWPLISGFLQSKYHVYVGIVNNWFRKVRLFLYPYPSPS